MEKQKARRISGVLSVVGSVVAIAFGFINVTRLFLVAPAAWDYFAFVVATALLGLLGAFPGMVVGWLISPRDTTGKQAGPPGEDGKG